MLKNYLLLVCLVSFCVIIGHGQTRNLSGVWEGRLFQNPGGTKAEFYYKMELKQTGNKVSGFSYVSHLDEKEIFGKISLTGKVTGNLFTFSETEITSEERKARNFFWCIKSGDLTISSADGKLYLKGPWRGNGTCSPGTVVLSKKIEVKTAPKPVKIVINGRVLSSDELKPLPAMVTFALSSSKKEFKSVETDVENGLFQFQATSKGEYSYVATAKDYFPTQSIVDLRSANDNQVVTMNILLRPIQINETIPLKNVFFAQTQFNLLPESYPELDRLTKIMQTVPTLEIRLEGHTDIIGNPDDNMALSENRVNAVKKYIIGKGISADRIQTQAFGGTKPIKTDGTDEERKINRRVEFVILKK